MASVRPYWKGYIKLALVSCPIGLYTASSSGERVAFRQINKKTGNRLRQQLVDEGTREPVEAEDKGRGYEVDKGIYIPVDDEEIEAIEIESKHTIEIDSFVPAAQIDKRYYDSPYYIMPNDNVGQEAFAVIRDAMKGKGMVVFSLGYSHPIEYPLPTGVDATVDPKQTRISLTGIDRQKVGQVAAEMRSLRPPDPYKNKGVRYAGERLKKKVGKTGAK